MLHKLLTKNSIDSLTYQLSIAEGLPQKPYPLPRLAPHLLQKIAKTHRGKRVKTTINKRIQEQVNAIVKNHYNNLSKNEIYRILFGTELDVKNFHKRPLSKFKHDVLKELKII